MDEADLRTRFESLYAAHAPTVARYVRRRSNADAVADVVSEVFIVAWRRLEDVPEDALPWLLACARRVLWHHQRSDRRRLRLLDRLIAVTPRSFPAAELSNLRLADALASLSEVDRESLLLTAWEGLTTDQAAQVLGCSAAAFRVRAHRARRRLAAAMREHDQGDEIRSIERCAND